MPELLTQTLEITHAQSAHGESKQVTSSHISKGSTLHPSIPPLLCCPPYQLNVCLICIASSRSWVCLLYTPEWHHVNGCEKPRRTREVCTVPPQWVTISGSPKASVSAFVNDSMKMITCATVTRQQDRKEQLFRTCLCLPGSLRAAPVTATLCTSETADGRRQLCACLISKASVPVYQHQPGWNFAKSIFWHICLLTKSTPNSYALGLLINIFLQCFGIMFASFICLPWDVTQRLSSLCASIPHSLGLPLPTDRSSTRPLQIFLIPCYSLP